ncbi:hypothetical protein JTB14_012924 [Gonioctena quinquepunctata]|nr:hypothetical protein JTB14_012924 [Gonioctena quinquepunctata]
MISDDSDCESDLEEIVLTISEDVEELGTGSTAVANDKKKSVINRHEMKEKDRFEDLTNNDVECESEEDETEYKIDIINEDVKSQMGPGTSIDQKFKPNASDYGTLLPHNVEEDTEIKRITAPIDRDNDMRKGRKMYSQPASVLNIECDLPMNICPYLSTCDVPHVELLDAAFLFHREYAALCNTPTSSKLYAPSRRFRRILSFQSIALHSQSRSKRTKFCTIQIEETNFMLSVQLDSISGVL